ncbi:cysteine-rich motor neuron 1 protein-like [Pomacea canaliculata]|uniref:cysteine-rich motor neuron 1 protein-like n=1 Tax=Pomacea canaliculata TaxID=400727 RepID=UPI000D72E6FC|nr:cysteine-rich motor neuron 1 protein-like [Pomacea canaliculata]
MASLRVVMLLALAARGPREVESARDRHRDDMGLICPPCHQIHCTTWNPADLRCEGGVTTGVCGCCPVCARTAGQTCGGDLAYLGKCDRGLTCLPPAPSTGPPLPRFPLQREEPGICTKEGEITSQQSDAALRRPCRPKCTLQYCTRHPRAICSASSVADPPRPCQGACQHTSCRACAVEDECVRCSGHDFQCLKQFGRCVARKRGHAVRRQGCRQVKVKVKVAAGQRLVCEVPECPG